MNVLIDINRNRRQYTSITLTNTVPPCLRVFWNSSRTCEMQHQFICLIKEMFFVRKFQPTLNVQTDSISAKVFA